MTNKFSNNYAGLLNSCEVWGEAGAPRPLFLAHAPGLSGTEQSETSSDNSIYKQLCRFIESLTCFQVSRKRKIKKLIIFPTILK